MTLLDHALDALKRGFSVFPCSPRTKIPAVRHGVLEATTDEEKICTWWKLNPNFNPAVTGGVIVDADSHLNSLQEVKNFALFNGIPPTLTVRTGRRPEWGIQWHFTGEAANGLYCVNSVTGEIRGRGLYGMAPGAIHPSGERYEILFDLPRVPFPPDLLNEARTGGKGRGRIGGRMGGKDYDALDLWTARDRYDSLLFRAAWASKGSRHYSANNVTFYAARGLLAGIFEEWAMHDGYIVLPRFTEAEIMIQIYRAVKTRYKTRERDLRKMLRDSWDSGISAGRLALDLYPSDFLLLQSLTDDVRFQKCWDGDTSDFPDAVAGKDYMLRVLAEAGCKDPLRVLRASAVFDAIAIQLTVKMKLSSAMTGSEIG